MKNIIYLTLLSFGLLVVSCKNDTKSEDATVDQPTLMDDSKFPSYMGEYFYSEDGAVLKGDSFIYAVTMDDMAKELGDLVAPIKNEEYDMIPVVVRGVVARNPALDKGQEVWEEIITIKEIVAVGDTPAEADIKIEESKS